MHNDDFVEGFDEDGIPILHAFQEMNEEEGIDPETAEFLQQQAEQNTEFDDIDRASRECD
jgi:hypothetical protein